MTSTWTNHLGSTPTSTMTHWATVANSNGATTLECGTRSNVRSHLALSAELPLADVAEQVTCTKCVRAVARCLAVQS